MRPGVVADLEAHAMDLRDVVPGHEIIAVRHPLVRNEEGGVEAQILQVRRNKCTMGFNCVVESEDDGFSRNARERQRAAHERAAGQHGLTVSILQMDCWLSSPERSSNAFRSGSRPMKSRYSSAASRLLPFARIRSRNCIPTSLLNTPPCLKRVNASASRTSAHLYE